MIELRNLVKRYGEISVVGPLNLIVAERQFIAILGGSGSGKTTTLKMVNGLVRPDAGEVWIDGREASVEPPYLLRRRIGYVFQEVGLFPHMTVAENIAIGPRLAGWAKPRTAERIRELLQLVALPSDVTERLPAALSGGQRQRVGVARSLAAGPAIMLMDEPFGALDPVIREGIARDYRTLHDQLNLTTVMVTHDVMEALSLADRIVVMEAGAILADDTPGALLADHPHPRVRQLMQTPRRQAARLEALTVGRVASDG
jgi:osmoprotectant transport system ATP-binding protein